MDWFVTEILTRLSFKTLSRCKSVSKHWLSLIDSHIAFRKKLLPCRLFIVHPLLETEDDSYIEYLITCDVLFEDKKIVFDTIKKKIDSSSKLSDMILKSANGLICLIDSNLVYAPRIWNVRTGELSSRMRVRYENGIPNPSSVFYFLSSTYGFGFDPVTNTHKVVGVWWRILSRESFCYVLTVGGKKGYDENNTWRKIETPPYPPYASDLSRVSVYVNGFIYWTTCLLLCGAWSSDFRPVCLVAFDVRSEKFKTITIPDFILDLPHYTYDRVDHSNPYMSNEDRLVDLLEVDGNLAMSIKISNKTYKIFMYGDGDGSWHEVSIVLLPFDLKKDQRVKFHGYGSNEKIIVILTQGYACGKNKGKERCVSIYCYDWKKDSWFEFEVNGIPSPVPHLCYDSFLTTLSGSLFTP